MIEAEKIIAGLAARRLTWALLLIGSRARDAGVIGGACPDSDWDLQLFTFEEGFYEERDWVVNLGLEAPDIYLVRRGRMEAARKITLVWKRAEIDIVVISARSVMMLSFLVALRVPKFFAPARMGLSLLGRVWLGGVVIVKGGKLIRNLVIYVVSHPEFAWLSQLELMRLVEGFVCDFLSARRKVKNGELLAAERWINLQLREANIALLHELRSRRGELSYPDARRAEKYLSECQVERLSIRCGNRSQEQLERALSDCLDGMTWLAGELVGDARECAVKALSLCREQLRNDVLER